MVIEQLTQLGTFSLACLTHAFWPVISASLVGGPRRTITAVDTRGHVFSR